MKAIVTTKTGISLPPAPLPAGEGGNKNPIPDRGALSTEKLNPASEGLHKLSVEECVELMQKEDRRVFSAMEKAGGPLSRFIEAALPGFLSGGRLVYAGAGTSGRLGVLDASEVPPTFQLPPGRIVGLIAGGYRSLRLSSEGREDDSHEFDAKLSRLKLGRADTLLGIAAGGTTACVHGALVFAKSLENPPLTGLLACTPMKRPACADHLIFLDTGPEVLTGSTRLKAGTATKLALNAISTTLMVKSGRVYKNLMVDLRATNLKLRDRACRIVAELTGLDREAALNLLDRAEGGVKAAVVMHARRVSLKKAEEMLEKAGGFLGKILKKGY